MKTALLSLLLLAPALAGAQQIDAYRYWYDDNAASATTSAVAATPLLHLNTNLPTGSLGAGYHRVSLQVRDTSGTWSVPRTSAFVRTSGLVNSYRYWLNDDPATVATASIAPGATFSLVNDLATSSLERFFNLVTIQFRESDGRYSVPVTKPFVRGSGAVNGYEYWTDDAIADRVSSAIGPSGMVNLIADLEVPPDTGSHIFTIRFSSVNTSWSVPLSSTYSYFTGIDELPGITDLLLFPNPATEQLGLRLNSDAGRTLQLEVVDLAGQHVLDLGSWAVAGSAWRNWDISGLASGTYLLRVTGEKSTWNTRFVKQ